jgi:hypothetical protein
MTQDNSYINDHVTDYQKPQNQHSNITYSLTMFGAYATMVAGAAAVGGTTGAAVAGFLGFPVALAGVLFPDYKKEN